MFFKPSFSKKNKIKYLSRLFVLRGNYSLMRIPIYHASFNTFGLLIFGSVFGSDNMEVFETNDDEISPSYGWGKIC